MRTRVERFANLFGGKHFPLYMPVIEFWTEADDEPPWSWLRRGIPFDLMGFGYDGLHELWNGYRDGISALLLLVKPPDSFYGESDEIRTLPGWSRPPGASRNRPWRGFPRAAYPSRTLTETVKDTRFEGAAKAASWVFAETGNFFLDHSYEDGSYDGFADPWEDEIIAEGTEEWRKASALMDSVCTLADWLEEDLPGRFAEMLDTVLPRLPSARTRKGGRRP